LHPSLTQVNVWIYSVRGATADLFLIGDCGGSGAGVGFQALVPAKISTSDGLIAKRVAAFAI